MKKIICMALFALMAVALTGNAQNNTYNMVIEMNNGTKITIGPNDIRNISFNNGQLIVSGEDLSSLVAQQNETKAMVEAYRQQALAQANQMQKEIMAEMAMNKAELQAAMARSLSKDEFQAVIAMLCSKAELNQSISDLTEYVSTMKSQVDNSMAMLFERIAALESGSASGTTDESVKKEINDLRKAFESDINSLQEQISSLSVMLRQLQTHSAENSAMIKDLQNQIDSLTSEVIKLAQRIAGQ